MKSIQSALVAGVFLSALLLSSCSNNPEPDVSSQISDLNLSSQAGSLLASSETAASEPVSSSLASSQLLSSGGATSSKRTPSKSASSKQTSSKKTPSSASSKGSSSKPSSNTSSKKPNASSKPPSQSNSEPTLAQIQQQVLTLVNQERSKAGLPALTLDATLCKAAQVRAKEIRTLFDHTRPDGSPCFTVLDEFNVSYSSVAENIAAGQTSPARVMNAWMNSPGHRKNILSKNLTAIGIGYEKNHWVQLFIG